MKTKSAVLIFIIFSLITPPRKCVSDNHRCKIYLKNEELYFDLGELQISGSYKISLDFESTQKQPLNGSLVFNFCKEIDKPVAECPDFENVFSYAYANDYCLALSNTDTFVNFSKLDKDSDIGIMAFYNNTNTELPYDFTYNVICSYTEDSSMLATYSKIEGGRPLISLTLKSSGGCYSDLSKIFFLLDEYYYLAFLPLMIIGLSILFLGAKHFKLGMAAISGLLGFGVSLGTVLWYSNYKTATITQIILTIFACGFCGVFAGSLLSYNLRLAEIAVGGIVGSGFGLLSVPIAEYISGYDFPFIIYVCLALSGALIFMIFSLSLKKHALIINLAILGGYIFIHGAGLLIGGYPDELSLARKFKESKATSIPASWWGYLACFIVLTIASICTQYYYRFQEKLIRKEEEEWEDALNKYKTIDG